MKQPKRIAVVGGGTAGYVAALILKARLDCEVDVIYSNRIGIVGVGEGSTEHWSEFLRHIVATPHEIVRECDATVKLGIMFQNWAKEDYLHSIQGGFDHSIGMTPTVYLKMIIDGATSKEIGSPHIWDNKFEVPYLKEGPTFQSNQFHFNTNSLNNWLQRKSRQWGINLIEDEILDVILNEQGEVSTIRGEKATYQYDFYIDATGFKRLLINKVGGKWNSYSKYLKMKSAIAFATPDTEEYNMWTVARAMDYGWNFRIPTWGRQGNGYIFDSDYITADQAKIEIEKLYGHEIEVGKTFNFDSGALHEPWIKNVVAVGLSANFVEPMEASSIGSSIQQSFLLMHMISGYDEKTIQKYNKTINEITDNIRDFIALHYVTQKDHTQFWKDIQYTPLPESLLEKLQWWHHHIPTGADFTHNTGYIMFSHMHHIHILHGLGLFNKNSLKMQWDGLNSNLKLQIEEQIKQLKMAKYQTISHKQAIGIIRNS